MIYQPGDYLSSEMVGKVYPSSAICVFIVNSEIVSWEIGDAESLKSNEYRKVLSRMAQDFCKAEDTDRVVSYIDNLERFTALDDERFYTAYILRVVTRKKSFSDRFRSFKNICSDEVYLSWLPSSVHWIAKWIREESILGPETKAILDEVAEAQKKYKNIRVRDAFDDLKYRSISKDYSPWRKAKAIREEARLERIGRRRIRKEEVGPLMKSEPRIPQGTHNYHKSLHNRHLHNYDSFGSSVAISTASALAAATIGIM